MVIVMMVMVMVMILIMRGFDGSVRRDYWEGGVLIPSDRLYCTLLYYGLFDYSIALFDCVTWLGFSDDEAMKQRGINISTILTHCVLGIIYIFLRVR